MAKVTFESLYDEFRAAPEERQAAAYRVLRLGQSESVAPDPGAGKFLTLKEAAKTLGFHPVTLYRWRVPGHRIGGRRRFLLSEVREFLLSRCAGGAPR